MRRVKYKIWSIVFAVLLLISSASCGQKINQDNEIIQTVDVPAESETESEVPDIGDHKDYDKEKAKCYYSNDVLIADQDGKKRGMELFDTGVGLSEFYGTELNAMKDRLGSKINVYSMIIPTACEIYCPVNMRKEMESQEEVQSYIRDMLVNVEEVDIFPTLKNHNAENIYFRTDNRWTALGAYYAAKVFAEKARVDFADISEYTEKTISKEYIGNFGFRIDDQGQKDFEENPDTFIYYQPKRNFKTYYYDEEFEYLNEDKFFEEVPDSLYDSYYKGGYYCIKLSTNVNTARKLIIIKDDFGRSIAPFFTSSFSEIYVVDSQYLEANLVEMIEEFCITDVLYMLNTFSVTGQRVYDLETLRSQASHGTLQDDAPHEAFDDYIDYDENEDIDTSEIQYVYDLGKNNPIGVVINSQVIDIDEYNNNIDYYNGLNSEEEEDGGDEEPEDYYQDEYGYYEE